MGKPFMSEGVVMEGADPHLVTPARFLRSAVNLGGSVVGILSTYDGGAIGQQHGQEAIEQRATRFTRSLRGNHPELESEGLLLIAPHPSHMVTAETVSRPCEDVAEVPDDHGVITESAIKIDARGGRSTFLALRTIDHGGDDDTGDYTVASAEIAAIDPVTMTAYEPADYSRVESTAMRSIFRRMFDGFDAAEIEHSLTIQPLPPPDKSLLKPVTHEALGYKGLLN